MLRYNPYTNKYPKGAIKNCEDFEIECFVKNLDSQQQLFFELISDDGTFHMYEEMKLARVESEEKLYKISLSLKNIGIYFYNFILKTNETTKKFGHEKYVPHEEGEKWQITVYSRDFKTPTKFKSSIMYQIFPDRYFRRNDEKLVSAFNESERQVHENWDEIPNSSLDTKNYSAKDFFGGSLNGINDKISHIKELSVDVIYLNPIFESAENHRYSTSNYFKIDSYLGDIEDFKCLVHKFKENGIKIVLDGVFSHTGADSIYFNKFNHFNSLGAYNSEKSEYFSWYSFKSYPEEYDSWWGFDNLPTVNKENENYLNFITKKGGVLEYWDELGIGGWRIDVADEFPDFFLEEMRKSIKSRNNENILIGEVWENASNKISYGKRRPYLLGYELDSVMNYPWRNAILKFVKEGNSKEFIFQIENILDTYPRESVDCMMNMLSTHDTKRAMLELVLTKEEENIYVGSFKLDELRYNEAKEKFKLATFIQFTLPGMPCIYYGDEIGMYSLSDPFNRQTMKWDAIDYDMLNFFKEICSFRKKYSDNFLKELKFMSHSSKSFSFVVGKLVVVVNCEDRNIYLEQFTHENVKSNKVFGSAKFNIGELGLIVSKNSFLALEMR